MARNHNHQELKELICTNQQLNMEISKLLAEATVTILKHVSENRILARTRAASRAGSVECLVAPSVR
jgi:hypothetical protein